MILWQLRHHKLPEVDMPLVARQNQDQSARISEDIVISKRPTTQTRMESIPAVEGHFISRGRQIVLSTKKHVINSMICHKILQ